MEEIAALIVALFVVSSGVAVTGVAVSDPDDDDDGPPAHAGGNGPPDHAGSGGPPHAQHPGGSDAAAQVDDHTPTPGNGSDPIPPVLEDTPTPTPPPTPDPTPEPTPQPTATPEPTATATPTPESTSSANAGGSSSQTDTPDGDGSTPVPESVLEVHEATLPADWVRAGYETTIRVRVENPTRREVTDELAVSLDGETVATPEVTLAAEAVETLEVEVVFGATEEATVAVEGVEAGTLTVEPSDGAGGPPASPEGQSGFGWGAVALALLGAILVARVARHHRAR